MISGGERLIHSNLCKNMSNLSMMSIHSNTTGTLTTALTTLVGPSATSERSLGKEIAESIHVLILSLCEALM